MEDKKPIYLSKTFWFSMITFVGGFVPAVQGFIVEQPEAFTTVWAFAAFLLRMITKDKVVLS